MQPTKDGDNPSRCSLWNTVTTPQVKKDKNGDSQNASGFMQIELGKIGPSLLHSIQRNKNEKGCPISSSFSFSITAGKGWTSGYKVKQKQDKQRYRSNYSIEISAVKNSGSSNSTKID